MNELIEYLKNKNINYQLTQNQSEILIDNKLFKLIKPNKDGLLFNDNFELIVDYDCDNYVYKFGGIWYYDRLEDIKNPKLNELLYLGQSVSENKTKSFLGVRGPYEILNGSRQYQDWCKKAKFLGTKNLGICEKNTLAGVLKFQFACQSNRIKPIIGATYTVYRKSSDLRYDVKFYVQNESGWQNLLRINKQVNVDNELRFIEEGILLNFLDGLYVIADPKSISYEDFCKIRYCDLYDFYQLDTVEYEDEVRDEWYLNNLREFYYSGLAPVSITDAFYLEKEHSNIKTILNTISGNREYKSTNQYFKDVDDYFSELDMLFNPEDDQLYDIYLRSISNQNLIADKCNFVVETGKRHLPKYKMTEEESLKYKDNEELFWDLLQTGLISRKISSDNYNFYLERIDREMSVIEKGGVIDYFLILWDIVNWARDQGILTGIGRGSAGGTLVAYLLGITHVNPIDFNLLFERFLNEGRVNSSLPDIDIDFSGSRRDEVKHYMERRYGVTQVCSVGTYTTLKLKALLKEFGRLRGVDVVEMNYITKILDLDDGGYTDIFKNACKNERVRKFVQENVDLIRLTNYLLKQPKSPSIHACATLILPEERTVFEWIPIKNMLLSDGQNMYVTEWEGGELEEIGLLKEDILGIAQLTKFQDILSLIKEKVDIYNIPYDDKEVFRYFKNGWNGDVFHFGSLGLTQYCKSLKPESIEDLIAGISLFRPGSMESGFHNEYIELKENRKLPEYDFKLRDVTEKTYGLYIYQEQIMEACRVLADFTLVEADDIRKALGKMKPELIKSYGKQFIDRAVYSGCPSEEAEGIWRKLERFASYGFNRSHAAAYTITGYISQWLKVHYPIEFWSVAFKYANENDYSLYISEIQKTGAINLIPVDINGSREVTYADKGKNTIYWSLSSIKQLGDVAVKQLIEDRDKYGRYFSFEEFLTRHRFKGSKVNKTVIENLITCGAFDDIESIDIPAERMLLIKKFRDINKVKVDTVKDLYSTSPIHEDWWWQLMQKKLSGIAFFNYEVLTTEFLESRDYFCPASELQLDSYTRYMSNVRVGGVLTEYTERENKKGEWCRMTLESNYDFINVTVWPEQFKMLEELKLEGEVGNIILLSGEIVSDKYLNKKIVQLHNNSEIVILS